MLLLSGMGEETFFLGLVENVSALWYNNFVISGWFQRMDCGDPESKQRRKDEQHE